MHDELLEFASVLHKSVFPPHFSQLRFPVRQGLALERVPAPKKRISPPALPLKVSVGVFLHDLTFSSLIKALSDAETRIIDSGLR